ncbi:hypothetical protein [uncultured Massilia sp.]|uniref:hypothetical protein n=1 Tax=uncultured Massilia sp. TaxID=169973 RepID=UPI0025EC3978|nr:hypothetical protein [uncultured Massilia sp.]
MIVLRLLSLLACGLLVIVLPVLLSDTGSGNLPLSMAVPAVLGAALMAAGFVYVGMMAERMRRPGRERWLGTALLTLPALACLAILATRHAPTLLWGSGMLLACTTLQLACVLNPGALERRRRPMRRREPGTLQRG